MLGADPIAWAIAIPAALLLLVLGATYLPGHNDPPTSSAPTPASCYHPHPVAVESVVPGVGVVAWWCPSCDVHGPDRTALGWTPEAPPRATTPPRPCTCTPLCAADEAVVIRTMDGRAVRRFCPDCGGRPVPAPLHADPLPRR